MRRAEEVLKHLEAGKEGAGANMVFAGNGYERISNGNGTLKAADGSGQYHIENGYGAENEGAQFIVSGKEYAWQSEEARLVAQRIEQADGIPPNLDTVDVCAITPLLRWTRPGECSSGSSCAISASRAKR